MSFAETFEKKLQKLYAKLGETVRVYPFSALDSRAQNLSGESVWKDLVGNIFVRPVLMSEGAVGIDSVEVVLETSLADAITAGLMSAGGGSSPANLSKLCVYPTSQASSNYITKKCYRVVRLTQPEERVVEVILL